MSDPIIKIRLANVMGLDADTPQHNIALEEALHGIAHPEEFIEFCRGRRAGIEFVSKTERLDILASQYKSKHTRSKVSQTFSEALAGKVKQVRTVVKNALSEGVPAPFSSVMKEGERFFSVKELKALAAVGSPYTIIELSERGRLAEEIKKAFEAAERKALGQKRDAVALAVSAAQKF